MTNQLPGTEAAALTTLFTLQWAADFDAALAGSAADPAPVVGAPKDSAPAQAFDDEVSASLMR